jgi:hypothetical protein
MFSSGAGGIGETARGLGFGGGGTGREVGAAEALESSLMMMLGGFGVLGRAVPLGKNPLVISVLVEIC